MAAVEEALAALSDLVGDELRVVTYKWLARRNNIPYDTAKRVLFEFLTRNGEVRAARLPPPAAAAARTHPPPTLRRRSRLRSW
jgi:hypothetical protein